MLNTAVLDLVQQIYDDTEIGLMRSALARISLSRQN